VKRGALIGAALLLGACSEGPDADIPPLPPETAESAESLMTEAERAARSAENRSEPKGNAKGSSANSNEVTP
jgi:hypothetical protein